MYNDLTRVINELLLAYLEEIDGFLQWEGNFQRILDGFVIEEYTPIAKVSEALEVLVDEEDTKLV